MPKILTSTLLLVLFVPFSTFATAVDWSHQNLWKMKTGQTLFELQWADEHSDNKYAPKLVNFQKLGALQFKEHLKEKNIKIEDPNVSELSAEKSYFISEKRSRFSMLATNALTSFWKLSINIPFFQSEKRIRSYTQYSDSFYEKKSKVPLARLTQEANTKLSETSPYIGKNSVEKSTYVGDVSLAQAFDFSINSKWSGSFVQQMTLPTKQTKIRTNLFDRGLGNDEGQMDMGLAIWQKIQITNSISIQYNYSYLWQLEDQREYVSAEMESNTSFVRSKKLRTFSDDSSSDIYKLTMDPGDIESHQIYLAWDVVPNFKLFSSYLLETKTSDSLKGGISKEVLTEMARQTDYDFSKVTIGGVVKWIPQFAKGNQILFSIKYDHYNQDKELDFDLQQTSFWSFQLAYLY